MRTLFGETDEATAAKTRAALDIGATAIVCIGESLSEREAGTTMNVCIRQLTAVKSVLSEADWAKIVIAYEPVWAIGTGKVATKEQAQEVHKDLREWLASSVSPAVASATRIVYGGSVNVRGGGLPHFPPHERATALPPRLAINSTHFFPSTTHFQQAANCVSLITETDIDGFLVGGASLKPEFLDIVKATASKA